MISSDPWIWLSGFLTLAIWSMLYKENVFFKWAQYTYIGVVIGHNVVTGYSTLTSRFSPLMRGADLSLLLTLILGIMSVFIVWKKYSWVASIPISIIVGVGTGLSLYSLVSTDVLRSMYSTLGEASNIMGASPSVAFSNAIRVVITLVVMFYFIFTIELKGPLRHLTTAAKYFLFMIFGFTVGNALTSYNTYFVTSLQRVLVEWLGLG
jgi:hypothetical protein